MASGTFRGGGALRGQAHPSRCLPLWLRPEPPASSARGSWYLHCLVVFQLSPSSHRGRGGHGVECLIQAGVSGPPLAQNSLSSAARPAVQARRCGRLSPGQIPCRCLWGSLGGPGAPARGCHREGSRSLHGPAFWCPSAGGLASGRFRGRWSLPGHVGRLQSERHGLWKVPRAGLVGRGLSEPAVCLPGFSTRMRFRSGPRQS